MNLSDFLSALAVTTASMALGFFISNLIVSSPILFVLGWIFVFISFLTSAVRGSINL